MSAAIDPSFRHSILTLRLDFMNILANDGISAAAKEALETAGHRVWTAFIEPQDLIRIYPKGAGARGDCPERYENSSTAY